ncbi:hypothetical protein EVAR_48150_1 [Eumeta japonica]|uniref:Uncharacterized protein n=1 Tax=Eumeta variegata TaxID=151549 RepID=A0A4C1WPU5_EUMVA|nr:hypothetical protein EVAR_48150_1 [Eumeta japonica]
MNARKLRRITSSLPDSWIGKEYLMEKKLGDVKQNRVIERSVGGRSGAVFSSTVGHSIGIPNPAYKGSDRQQF